MVGWTSESAGPCLLFGLRLGLWVFVSYLGTEGSPLSSETHQALLADIPTLERVVSKVIAVNQAFLGRDGKGDLIVRYTLMRVLSRWESFTL